jgi:hypothetical protein
MIKALSDYNGPLFSQIRYDQMLSTWYVVCYGYGNAIVSSINKTDLEDFMDYIENLRRDEA